MERIMNDGATLVQGVFRGSNAGTAKKGIIYMTPLACRKTQDRLAAGRARHLVPRFDNHVKDDKEKIKITPKMIESGLE
jgi:hypothetical protein